MASRAGKTPYQTYWTSNNPSARSSGESIDQNPGHDSGGFLSWRDNSPKSADLLASREYFDKNRRNASNHDGYGLIVKNTERMSIKPIHSDGVFVVTSPAEILPLFLQVTYRAWAPGAHGAMEKPFAFPNKPSRRGA
jgi:hypothetical protein